MADDQRHTLELIARHLIVAARPLIDAGQSSGAFMRLMWRLGFSVSDVSPAFQQLATTVTDASHAIDSLPDPPSPQDLAHLLLKAKGIYEAIQQLAGAPAPTGTDAAAYAEEIGERLFELLLTDYLAAEQPQAFNILSMLRVVTVEMVPATATRPDYVRRRFRWEEIPKVVSDPSGLPMRVYGWGTPDFDAGLLLRHVTAIGVALGLPVAMRPADGDVMRGYVGMPNLTPPPAGRSLMLPFWHGSIAGNPLEAALALQRLPPQGGSLPGLILEPRLPSDMPLDIALGEETHLAVRAGTNAGELFGITLRPPGEVAIRYPLAPGTPPPAAGIGIGVTYTPSAPVALLGDPKASRMELASATLGLTADVKGSDVSLAVLAELKGLKLVIAPGDGDSFLRNIVGDSPSSVDVPLAIEWSRDNGIRFKGSAAFEVMLHPHLQLGPVRVDDVSIRLATPSGDPPRVDLLLTASLSGKLGPLSFMITGIGIDTNVAFVPGNAGPFDISLGFHPPNGVGLSVDGGGFAGGGFLILDAAKGEYAGGLDLMFEDTIAIRAIGILTTKMPDGSEGFSLLILIATDFPPIQLSFGFTLNGVGGLLGLNRGLDIDVLHGGLRDGSLGSILFPVDVVANAARIISDLGRVFPPQRDLFLFGPMAKLGWGTPRLITLEVGVMLDLPRPIVVIVGILRAVLPTEDAPLLELQVNFVGVIDFAAGQLAFDATLYDSQVLGCTLTGDMAARVYWKENSNLLLTVGGFHPAYTPPPMSLPQLSRLAIVLFEGNPDVRADAYFAVTSNTIQFGARLQLSYSLSVFNVAGFLSLDVLIHRHPFHFIADVAAMLAVRTGSHVLFSIQLHLMLEGPTPWHAHGTASFEIGFIFTITIDVEFDVTIGDPLSLLLAPVDVLAQLADAIANPANWIPRLPPATSQTVTLRAQPGDAQGPLVVHPFGSLEVAQKIAPLGIVIQRFGATVPERGSVFRIADVKLGVDDAPTAPVREQFAPAQFFDMTDAEALSRPSFEDFDAGVAIGGDAPCRVDWMRVRDVAYEVIYLPEHHPVRVRFSMPDVLSAFSAASAAARSPMSRARTAPSALADRVSLRKERFAVASADDLTLHAPDLIFDTAIAADQAVRRLKAQRPELADRVVVVPSASLVMEPA
jgi:hypothetical protein